MITQAVTQLRHGERMTRETFHRLYEQAPKDVKAELIGGTVHMAAAMKLSHGEHHGAIITLFCLYRGKTPGVRFGDNVTVMLGDGGAPQPDALLRIEAECGGQSTLEDGYVVGPPELTVEISDSSLRLDINAKRDDYRQYGVLEYLVVDLQNQQVRWFELQKDVEHQADEDGVIRVGCFPGMWIDVEALLTLDIEKLTDTFEAGLQSPEYLSFRDKLAQASK